MKQKEQWARLLMTDFPEINEINEKAFVDGFVKGFDFMKTRVLSEELPIGPINTLIERILNLGEKEF